MIFEKEHLYHIYNQGNNHQKIFFKRENYLFFLRKVRTHFLPYCDILAYCLMPNHFHFMVRVNNLEVTRSATQSRAPSPDTFQKSIGILLASYTRAINKQRGTSGSLFRSKTKAECLNQTNGITPSFYNTKAGTQIHIDIPEKQYPQVCFSYIHQNPVRAKLTSIESNWEFSSAADYAGLRMGTLINKTISAEFVYW